MKKAKKKSIRNNIDILIGIAVILIILTVFYYFNFYTKAEYNQQSLTAENNQTQTSKEVSNPCANVVCNDYCSGNYRYYNGYCKNGQCKYLSQYCDYGCSNGLCAYSPYQQCQNAGNNWCNNQCYNSCPSGQRFNCPASGNLTCIITHSIDEYQKSIVYIRHDVTGCCYYGQLSSQLGGSGSGVIYYKNDNIVDVLTSRHVVDCVFAGTCLYPSSESITIKAQNGKFYTPSKVLYAPQNLDLAVLEFQTTDTDINSVVLNSENYSIGDSVTAIGYPVFGVQSTEPVLEFSITQGSITNIYNLLTYQGLSFNAIDSNALTGHGASGGGLFSQDGYLMGIITWGNAQQTIAIDIGVLSNIVNSFVSCQFGYHTSGEGCCSYGTIYGSDGKCHTPCGSPTIYCSTGTCCNERCTSCSSGYYLGNDCLCYRYPPTPWG
jgi:S1-C subfamily serine protease